MSSRSISPCTDLHHPRQICSYLELRDLVRFVKSSKKLHKMLLARDARLIWSRCRERMGYSLPQDMSEFQYALFIAGESCQVMSTSLSIFGPQLTVAIPQHCRSASDYNELQFTWMVRFCYHCTRFSQYAASFALTSTDA